MGTNKNTLTVYRRHTRACGMSEPTLYPNTDRDRRADTCRCPINVHGYLTHHVGRIRHYSLETSDWIEADRKRVAMLTAGRLPGSADPRSKPSGAISVKFAVDAFLNYKGEGTGKVADATLDTYKVFCNRRLLPWCEVNGVSAIDAFDELDTTERFDQSWKHLKLPTKDLAGESRKTTMTIFRVFLNYCVDRGWLKTNTARRIKPTKARQRHRIKNKRYGLELHEYQNVLRFMESEKAEPCVKAIIELMFYSGMRVSDATKFCASELVRNHRDNGWNADFIAQKNGKQCSVPLPDHVVGMLKALPFKHEQYWFMTGKETVRLRSQYAGKKIADVFKATQKMFGAFAHPATAHTLRHTFAIQRLNGGVDVKIVADWMGDDISMVLKHYSHAIRSTQEMQEDAGKLAIETMNAKMKVMGTPDKVVTFRRKRA
jgi:site-specific recombinase XerD